MKQQPSPILKQKPLLYFVVILIIVALFRSCSASTLTSAPVLNWNTQNNDATKNNNVLLSLYCLKTNISSTPISPLPHDVLKAPMNYFGQCLQLTGTVKSVQTYPAQRGLSNLIVGNSTEVVLVASDGTTIIDCLILGTTTSLNVGSTVSVYGYTPGLRYIQNTQGGTTSELVLIAYLG